MKNGKKSLWRICTAIMAKDTEDAISKMRQVAVDTDLLEIRLDAMEAFDLAAIIDNSPCPLVVTCRSHKEGGKNRVDEEKRAEIFRQAIDKGADFVDIELSMPYRLRKNLTALRGKTQIIISTHLFEPVSFHGLEQLVLKIFEAGADVGKLIGYAADWDDNLNFLSLVNAQKKSGNSLISFAMGPYGRPSRIMSPVMGAPWTYAALSEDQQSAPGQLTVKELRHIWGKIYGN